MIVSEPSENYQSGFVKIYRSIINKGYYIDSEVIHLWVHLLLKANHRGAEFLLGENIIRLKPGQFITGRHKLSLETGIKEWKIEKALKIFENEGQIQQQTNSANRVITILLWDEYQNNQQQTNSGTTAEQQRNNTNKNDKNVKNDKKYIVFVAPALEEVVSYFTANGYSTFAANKAFKYYSETNWIDSRGNKVRNWKQKMQAVWFKDEYKSQENGEHKIPVRRSGSIEIYYKTQAEIDRAEPGTFVKV